MPHRPPTFNTRPDRTAPGRDNRVSSRKRGYDSRWTRESLAWRRLYPLCQYCEAGAFAEQRTEACTRVDHLYPQRRHPGVFWVIDWWVSSCDVCDAAKQALENGPQAGLDALAIRMRRPVLKVAGGV